MEDPNATTQCAEHCSVNTLKRNIQVFNHFSRGCLSIMPECVWVKIELGSRESFKPIGDGSRILKPSKFVFQKNFNSLCRKNNKQAEVEEAV